MAKVKRCLCKRMHVLCGSFYFPSNLNITTIKELVHARASHLSYAVPVSSIFIVSLNASLVGLAVSSEGSENLPLSVGLDASQQLQCHQLESLQKPCKSTSTKLLFEICCNVLQIIPCTNTCFGIPPYISLKLYFDGLVYIIWVLCFKPKVRDVVDLQKSLAFQSFSITGQRTNTLVITPVDFVFTNTVVAASFREVTTLKLCCQKNVIPGIRTEIIDSQVSVILKSCVPRE
ncbi:polynucleotide 5'-hydroxyl-kinase nol9 [Quercus suber]|uniref:Polynucleotide 5'-hydroxyl-kinase nol9 n=1 Tax=Quercus suber TaxID=58331 RepID=A0AAW0M6V4_QUESU